MELLAIASPLNQIDNFHVTNSQLPQDVMHMLLEGMLPLETKLMIFYTGYLQSTLQILCLWKSRIEK